jgi:hypothetical protein
MFCISEAAFTAPDARAVDATSSITFTPLVW